MSICIKGFFLITFLCSCSFLNAQKLVDYLEVATRNFIPQSNINTLSTKGNTTELEFGFFVEPQYTISGAQKAYVSLMQQVPWLGKASAYRKARKYTDLHEKYSADQQKELLKFNVKKCYYELYKHQYQKDQYVILADKLRKYIEVVEKDTLNTSAKALLKLFERKQQLTVLTEKLQLVDGNYQNALLEFNRLLKQDSFQEVELPLELAMPTEDQTISFSDTYENPLFLSYENELLALQEAQKYTNKWLPTLSVGLRYAKVVENDDLTTLQLPVQDLVEPRIKLQWDLFTKSIKPISEEKIEAQTEQKIQNVTSLLQVVINDQISARISYFSVIEKQEQLDKLKAQLLEKNVSLDADEEFQLTYLGVTYKIEEIETVANYYISSSEMLLYQ